MKIKSTLIVALLVVCFHPSASANSVAPCQTSLLVSVENTSCGIGNLVLTFGTAFEFPPDTIFTPSSSGNGFTLTGNASAGVQGTLGLGLGLSIATQSGMATIGGVGSTIFGTGIVPGGDGFIVADFLGCSSLAGFPGGFCKLPTPVASLQGGLGIFIRSSHSEPATFTSGIFRITEVPEPSSLLLLGSGLLGVIGTAVRRTWLG